MYRFICLTFLFIIIAVSLFAEFPGTYNVTGTAYLKDGTVINGYFFISLEDVLDYNYYELKQPLDYDRISFKHGENILWFFQPAYIKHKSLLNYSTEVVSNEYGNFAVDESRDILDPTDIDSLIFIDNNLGQGFTSIQSISRKQAELQKKKAISTWYLDYEFSGTYLINTNPSISWQEMYLYATQCITNEDYAVSWYKTNDEEQQIVSQLVNSYTKLGRQALPELIDWTDKAVAALQSVLPYTDSLTCYSAQQRQEIKEAFLANIQKCRELKALLDQQKKRYVKRDLDQIMNDCRNHYYYFKTVFYPTVPCYFFETPSFEDFLYNKGIAMYRLGYD